MTVTAAMVKELRERTGAGMMECKNALTEAQGDMEAAIETMRVKGKAKADKKASRTAAEGVVCIKVAEDGRHAIILEVNCETDFVAKGDKFAEFADLLSTVACDNRFSSTDTLSAFTHNGQTLDDLRKDKITELGENISIRRLQLVETDKQISSYQHGAKIGVLICIAGGNDSVGKDLAMHIAASKPVVISADEVSEELIEKEKSIYLQQAQESGKPQDVIEKMVQGRIKKFLNEVSLLGQPFVKDPSVTVEKYLMTAKATVENFVRFEVGEGIEKKVVDFAKEVEEQVRGS